MYYELANSTVHVNLHLLYMRVWHSPFLSNDIEPGSV